MSAWGTGVSQSDEFADIYDEFFDAYTGDADPFDIQKKIWKEYKEEFPEEEDDPILYTVRYALAQCLWECGVKDEALWAEIDEIIHSGKELRFWDELSEHDPITHRQRQKSMERFWAKINSTPKRIRKPKKLTKKRPPSVHKGDVFAYAVPEGGYRAAIVFDCVSCLFLFAVTDTVFSGVPAIESVWESQSSLVFWGVSDTIIPKKARIFLGNVMIQGDYNGRAGLYITAELHKCSNIADRGYFFASETSRKSMRLNFIKTYQMKELMNPKRLPPYDLLDDWDYRRWEYERKHGHER